ELGGAGAGSGVVRVVKEETDSRPRRFRDQPRAEVWGRRVPVAQSRHARLLGLALLDRRVAGPGLLLPGCRSVHTFGMRFPLDLEFLDGALRPVAAHRGVGPRRVRTEHRSQAVLELPAPARGEDVGAA